MPANISQMLQGMAGRSGAGNSSINTNIDARGAQMTSAQFIIAEPAPQRTLGDRRQRLSRRLAARPSPMTRTMPRDEIGPFLAGVVDVIFGFAISLEEPFADPGQCPGQRFAGVWQIHAFPLAAISGARAARYRRRV